MKKPNLSLKGKHVCVTGGAGFIGSHVVDAVIKERPASIIVLDNLFLGKESNLEDAKKAYPLLVFYKIDVSDYSATKKIFDKHTIDVVFNLAVQPLPYSLEHPRECFMTNCGITANICELCRQKKITLIHFSSSEAYGTAKTSIIDEDHPLDPITPYAASKSGTDHLVLSYIRTYGLDSAIARPFNTYGPRQNEGSYAGVIPATAKKLLSGNQPVIYGDGKQTRDFAYVEDTAQAAIAIYAHPETRGRILNIATGEEVTIHELIQTIQKIMGDKQAIAFEPDRPGDVRRLRGDARLLNTLAGFKPRIKLAEGLKKTIDWYKKTLK